MDSFHTFVLEKHDVKVTGRAAQDMVGLRMLDLQTPLCCCCGHAALGTRKRKHPCLVEAEGWHLQAVLGS